MIVKDGSGNNKYLETVGAGTEADPHRVVPADPMLEIARGNVAGQSKINKFGANDNVGLNTWEDVWMKGGTMGFYPTAAITHVATAGNSASALGAVIEVSGLEVVGSDWVLKTQQVTLSATDSSIGIVLPTPLIRVFRMKLISSVSPITSHVNAMVGDGGNVVATIKQGDNQTLMATFTVPSGKTAYITQYYCTYTPTGTKDPTSIKFRLLAVDTTVTNSRFQVKHEVGIPKGGSAVAHTFKPYDGGYPAKTDIKMSAYAESQGADVAAGFDLILVDD